MIQMSKLLSVPSVRPFAFPTVILSGFLTVALAVLSFLVPGQAFADRAQDIAVQQQKIAEHFLKLEENLLRMSEIMSVTDPQRSAVLKRVILQSRQSRIQNELQEIESLLNRGAFGEAVEIQDRMLISLRSLLVLMENENRHGRIQEERERIQSWLTELNLVVRMEQSIYGRTEELSVIAPLASEQLETGQRTGVLSRRIADEAKLAPLTMLAAAVDGKDPTKIIIENLAMARGKMDDAEKRLRGSSRKSAMASEEAALLLLEQAKSDIETILVQLREEEALRSLTQLSERLKAILQQQSAVNSETSVLVWSAKEEQTNEQKLKIARLSKTQLEIALEGEKSLLLLTDEGTSKMFPIALKAIIGDMNTAGELLKRGTADKTVKTIQDDIAVALQEMIDAIEVELVAYRQEAENADNSGSDANGAQPSPDSAEAEKAGEQKSEGKAATGALEEEVPAYLAKELVAQLTELKMIRASQLRVNRRTKVLEQLRSGSVSSPEDVETALIELRRQQEQIREVTKSLSLQPLKLD